MTSLTDLSIKRNWKQATVFFFAYLFLSIFLGSLTGGFAALIGVLTGAIQTPEESYNLGYKVGLIINFVYILSLTFLLFRAKNFFKKFFYILFFIIIGLIQLFLPGVPLLLIAFFTTMESIKIQNSSLNQNTYG